MSLRDNLDDERRERAKTLKRERDRRYRETHREERRASGRRYYAANPEKMKRKAALWTMARAWGNGSTTEVRRTLGRYFNPLLLAALDLAQMRSLLRCKTQAEREACTWVHYS